MLGRVSGFTRSVRDMYPNQGRRFTTVEQTVPDNAEKMANVQGPTATVESSGGSRLIGTGDGVQLLVMVGVAIGLLVLLGKTK